MEDDLTMDSLDFDFTPEDTEPVQEPPQQDKPQQQSDSDAITDYLKSLGIDDPNKIKFEDDNGTVNEKSWKDLSEQEKLGILQTPNVKQIVEDDSTKLDDEELKLINYLRENNLSPDDYAQYLYNQGASAQPKDQIYTVDSLSDDELYVADMQVRAKDMTDQELQAALENAKSNPDTYKKYIDGLRTEYKNLEDQQKEQEAAEVKAQQEEQFNAFSNNIMESINDFTNVGGMDIEMDDQDKNELAQFILGQDGAGINYLTKAFNDPKNIVAASWFLLHGQDTFDQIQSYISEEVKKARKAGYDEALNKKPKSAAVVVKKNVPQYSSPDATLSIEDIDFNN